MGNIHGTSRDGRRGTLPHDGSGRRRQNIQQVWPTGVVVIAVGRSLRILVVLLLKSATKNSGSPEFEEHERIRIWRNTSNDWPQYFCFDSSRCRRQREPGLASCCRRHRGCKSLRNFGGTFIAKRRCCCSAGTRKRRQPLPLYVSTTRQGVCKPVESTSMCA